jgi:predicted O-methyltransferase YrrM
MASHAAHHMSHTEPPGGRDGDAADRLAREAIELHGAIQKRAELRALTAFLADRRLHSVVEIGTARGGTLWLWTRLAEPDATIVSIDAGAAPPEAPGSPDAVAVRRCAGRRLVLLRGNSHDQRLRHRCGEAVGGQIDLLFIDGDHSYEGCRADVEMYGPLVRPGGLVVLHDILPHPQMPSCQVDRLWRELRPRGRWLEFVDPQDDQGWGQWGGIGVIAVV